jgi:hypothetical protein
LEPPLHAALKKRSND